MYITYPSQLQGIYEGCARVYHLPLSDARRSRVCGARKGLVRGEGYLQRLRSCISPTFQVRQKYAAMRGKKQK